MLVFIDESGDPGMRGKPGSSPFFAVTAVLFEETEEAMACEERILRCRQELKVRPSFEFKFYSCSDKYRACFLEAVSSAGFFYHTVVLNKAKLWSRGFQDKHSFYKYTTSLVFENAKPHLREATVVIDRCGDHLFRKQLSKYLKRKMNEGGRTLIKSVKMEPSHSNHLLQLADMVCGAIARSFNVGKPDRMRFRQIIKHRELRVQVWPK
jgi:hypothetical protein